MDEGDDFTLETPALDHIIERPRLIAKIEEADARVTLFCAPAGYGKTTLARQWSARARRSAWYRTTRASGDVAALAVGLDTLLARVAPPKDRDPRRIAAIASVNPNPGPLGRALVSMYRRLSKSMLLVVDEYEAADTAEADELFGMLVDGLPIRFLFTSRRPPTWFGPKLSVYGEAFELGIDDLTMNEEEALAVLERGGATNPDPTLLERAQGWPAVLGVAAMSSDRDLPQEKLLPRALYDYLASELLEAAPQEVQDALLLLAAASVGSVEVARLLLGRKSKTILEEAAKRRLVILGNEGELSLHPLLRELLLMELKGMEEPELVAAQLHPLIKARRWDEALAAAQTLRAAEFVTEALMAAIDDLLRNGRTETLGRLALAARSAGVDRMLVAYAESEIAYRAAEFDKALVMARRAAKYLKGDLGARAYLCAARAAHLAGREGAREDAQKAQQLCVSASTRAASLWAEFTAAADEQLTEMGEILQKFCDSVDDSEENELRTATGRLIVALLDGTLETALETFDLAQNLVGEADPLVASGFLVSYGDHLLVAARYEEALTAIDQAADLARRYELEFVRRFALAHRGRALTGLRRFRSADRALNDLQRALNGSSDRYTEALLTNQRAGLFLSVGEVERASAILRGDPGDRVSRAVRAERFGLRAIALAATGKLDAAKISVGETEAMSRLTETRTLASVAKAIVALQEDRQAEVVTALEQASAWDVRHPLVIGMRAWPQLAVAFAERREHRELLASLMTCSNDSTLARNAGLEVDRSARRSDLLSPRELEIHELIAQGLTNPEIAKLLFIAPSTTKVHVRNVLAKLGVRSRVEAARVWQAPEGEEDV